VAWVDEKVQPRAPCTLTTPAVVLHIDVGLGFTYSAILDVVSLTLTGTRALTSLLHY
jgi:hypothetical protein